jgi:hypothetical protein
MAIHFVTGRPGAGKSFYSMKLIIEELRGTERKIVTNLSIIPENLAEMLHKKHGETFDLLNRLHIIADDEIEFFYCHRGGGLPTLDLEYNAKGKPEKFDIAGAAASGGVFYILDEVHLSFGARNWQNMGNAAIYYSSQHRKLGDDVILITQAPKMVDTTFRNLAQDYTVLRNHALETLFFFKAPKVFTRQTFLNLPTANESPMEKSTFRLDMDVANCYDTSQGVGIHERGDADTKSDKRKGLPWYVAVIAFVLLIYVGAQVPSACGKLVAGKVSSTSEWVTDKNSTIFGGDRNSTEIIDTNETKIITTANVSTNQVTEEIHEKIEVSGWLSKGSLEDGTWEFIAILSTGKKLSLLAGDIVNITSRHVEDTDGNKFPFSTSGPNMQRILELQSGEGENSGPPR